MKQHVETSNLSFLKQIQKLVTRFPGRDTRYISAASFFVGASLFVANGFLYIFMAKEPQLIFDAAALPVTSVVGTFCFLVGCSAAILEVMNTVEPKFDGGGIVERDVETEEIQMSEKIGVVRSDQLATERLDSGSSLGHEPSEQSTMPTIHLIGEPAFKWIPTTKDLKSAGFWAAIISFTGIIPFYISAIAYIPGVADLNDTNTWYYLALLPYCLGGCLFTIAAVMQTILIQRKWYIPALTDLAWYSGFLWSVGSFGFALGGSLWYAGEGQYWSATLASFWGAWCWVVGSALRCFAVVGEY